MKRRSILLVAVAVLMVTSGCLGGAFDGQTNTNTTDAPVGEGNPTESTADENETQTPTNSTDTTRESNESWIVAQHPGISKNSVNASTVVNYHIAQTVRDGSYYVHQRTNYQTGDQERRSDSRVIVEPTKDTAFWVERTEEEKRSYFAGENYNGTYVKIETDNQTSFYHTPELVSIKKYTHGTILTNILQSGEYKPTETLKQDGAEMVRLTTTTPNEAHLEQDVDSYRGFVLVDDEGRIRAAGHYMEWTENGVQKSITVRISYEEFGEVQVEEPDWLDTAIEESEDDDSTSNSTDG